MSTDLNRQLRTYGDVVYAQLGTVNVEDIMSTKLENDNVTALKPVGQEPPSDWRRNFGYAAAAFGLILAVAIAATMALSGSGEVANIIPAPPFEAPEDAAIAYFDNVNGDGDYAAYGAMFTADALNAHLDIRGVMDDVKEQQRYESLAAEDALMELTECEPPEGSVVFCDVILREGTLVSIQGGSIDFRMRLELSPEGLISRLNLFPVSGSQARELAFLAWMRQNHPELQEEFYLQLWDEAPLVRSVEQVIAEFLVAEAEFVAENP